MAELVSWKPGLDTVHLIHAVRDHSAGSLARAKADVERFLSGERVQLQFSDKVQLEAFRSKADKLGVTCRYVLAS